MITPREYQDFTATTEAPPGLRVVERLSTVQTVRLLHAAIGLATEAGELLDALKKHIFYGKPLDCVNISEELGDVLFYVGMGANALGEDMGQIMETNRAKLQARYGNKFSETAALSRDLEAERKILEGNPCGPC